LCDRFLGWHPENGTTLLNQHTLGGTAEQSESESHRDRFGMPHGT